MNYIELIINREAWSKKITYDMLVESKKVNL